MGENVFAKFNEMFDLSGLKTDIESAASNSGDFVEVPDGSYEVKVSKLELGQTGEKSKNPGMPMMKVWFDILAGDFKGQKMRKLRADGENLQHFLVHIAFSFLFSGKA